MSNYKRWTRARNKKLETVSPLLYLINNSYTHAHSPCVSVSPFWQVFPQTYQLAYSPPCPSAPHLCTCPIPQPPLKTQKKEKNPNCFSLQLYCKLSEGHLLPAEGVNRHLFKLKYLKHWRHLPSSGSLRALSRPPFSFLAKIPVFMNVGFSLLMGQE